MLIMTDEQPKETKTKDAKPKRNPKSKLNDKRKQSPKNQKVKPL